MTTWSDTCHIGVHAFPSTISRCLGDEERSEQAKL